MEKKIKFSENPKLAKIIYAVIIAALCITAIIIGIVAANNRTEPLIPNDNITLDNSYVPEEKPPVSTEKEPEEEPPSTDKKEETKPLTFISPVSGTVMTEHSLTVPVFSPTLEDWRVHTGIDIKTEESASVFAAADGTVREISTHPRFGYTVKIEHANGITTVYSNLSSLDEITVKVGDKVKCGDKIATVGDSAVYELADDPHLHFEAIKNGAKIDPLSIISDEAKEVSLGIKKS
ncbi:MAG: M23 family metallopeptidase [Clostridia bacterium]|nr:M23 family metallopeptidase [Clostridia bacterium]